jgi:phosphate-selective porin
VSVDNSALAKDGHPLAGFHNGLFFLRDYNDNFRLYIQGRLQLDAYTYFGPGVPDSSLKDTILVRRIRPELTGEFMKYFQWQLAGDWGQTAVDNSNGKTTESSAAAPGAAPSATSGRFASAQTASIKAAVTDAWIGFHADDVFNLQFGQYDAPFTMENRTSDKYLPFMERSLAVRDVGMPDNKEIGLMAWGETPGGHANYALGMFLGDGQNRLDMDGNAEFIGRIFLHPLATSVEGPLKDLQIGASLLGGTRGAPASVSTTSAAGKTTTTYNANGAVNFDYPAMTTQGNWTFWANNYQNSMGTYTHVLPAGKQTDVAVEIRIPVSIVDLTSEIVYINNGTREAVEGYQATNTERFGAMTGTSYYIQAGVWPFGVPSRDIQGRPGYENPAHLNFAKADAAEPLHAVQVLAKWEQVMLKYDSTANSPTAARDAKDISGEINVNAFSLGVNYWFTKHVRLTANYVYNMFPNSLPTSASAAKTATTAASPSWGDYKLGDTTVQRAQAPGNAITKGIDDASRNTATSLQELLFRVAVAF